jgi:large subunit ribosomal protein L30
VAEGTIQVTQVRSVIGRVQGQRRTIRALGLRRIRHTVTVPDRPEIRGMIRKVAHLVEVRYPGDDAPLDLEPGQEPKGAGNAPAGPSVPESEATERAEALEEIRAQEGEGTALGDLVDNAPTLTSVDNPDRPKPARGTLEDEDVPAEPPALDAEADADEDPIA